MIDIVCAIFEYIAIAGVLFVALCVSSLAILIFIYDVRELVIDLKEWLNNKK